ncbi:hypothetical protein BGZ70_009137 [Mortierella alpina]|uniref:ubiquitinyl hydrolase 1 n=1 Tax=Mortierella alpina TaxID=64518 RepID=A0A9P6M0P9_MORAP|nr:hypothetical protein BGZ70_009137 [Mortierella alpina]
MRETQSVIKKEKREKGSKTESVKVALKRSRSPIKLIKNIKSYLHVNKHRHSSGSAGGSPKAAQLGFSHSINNNLAPPRTSLDGAGHHYRSTSLPSSSILSAAQSAVGEEPPRPQKASDTLDPEKQVLLLRVMSYFEHAGHRADEETADYLLSSYRWDIDQTLQYCQDLVQAVQGSLVPVQQETKLNGAVNDQMTSCYIDALLFAMFARLSAFEGLLNVNLDAEDDSDSDGSGEVEESRREEERQEHLLHTHRLQTWLRMFVNQLRSGRLIQAHVVKELRQHMYSCGWHCPGPYDPPGSSRQEDSSELFMFLTEKLHLPYLPLEQRLLHGAKMSADDDKVITERMLQISISRPESPTQELSPTKHESAFSRFLSPKTPWHSSKNTSQDPGQSPHEILSLENLLEQHFYDSTLTGIRRLVSSGTGAPLSPGVEVPVSAWQVLELLPFYSSSNEQGGIIHASQSQYPADVVILPLILKRYSIGPDMQARRISTPIDIPRRIDFSRFVNPQSTHTPVPLGPDVDHRSPHGAAQAPDPTRARSSSSSSSSSRSTHAPAPASASPPSPPPSDLSGQQVPPMKINTIGIEPPIRKYSMSLLQAADSPRTPSTPPPQYTPGVEGKQFQDAVASGDRKNFASPLPQEGHRGDYMDCHPPKVKYILELKSVVCHLGSRLDAGHYRSYVADTVGKSAVVAGTLSPAKQEGHSHSHRGSSPLAHQEPNWLRHDDLDPSNQRVQLVERNSAENMDMEADWARNGYILFYELQTIQCS